MNANFRTFANARIKKRLSKINCFLRSLGASAYIVCVSHKI